MFSNISIIAALNEILTTYDKNVSRLNNLIKLYEDITVSTSGRKVIELDLLRATVVFTHSTMEDLLRSIMEYRMPSQPKEVLNGLSLAGTSESGRSTKFALGELVGFKGKTVDEVLLESIKEHLSFQSFNNTTDIAGALRKIGLEVDEEIEKLFPTLDDMIKRRHKIVHNADRKLEVSDVKYNSITLLKVKKWKGSVDKLCVEIVKQLRTL